MTSNPHRLPRTVHPDRYDLVLEPDLDGARFQGLVDVALVVDAATDELVCNAAELGVSSAVLTVHGTAVSLPSAATTAEVRVSSAALQTSSSVASSTTSAMSTEPVKPARSRSGSRTRS